MIADKTIREFIDELKSEAPTPGGGGVAALNAANGTALIMMVANLSITVSKHPEWAEPCQKAIEEADKLLEFFLAGADADAEEFSKVITAYSLPQGEERTDAIARASISAARAPLIIMENCVRALEIDRSMFGRSNPNLESDLYVAAVTLQSGLISAKFNVDANIPAIAKIDEACAKELAAKAEQLLEESSEICKEILK